MTVGSVGDGVSGKLSTFIMGREWCGRGRQMNGFMVLPLEPGLAVERKYLLVVKISFSPQVTTLAI